MDSKTMQYIPEELSLLVSSATSNGAVNKSSDGSRFEVAFQDPLRIGEEYETISVEAQEVTIWWTVPNIITGVNDRMYISYNDGINPIFNYVVVVPQGLYGLAEINAAILRALENFGAAPNLISLTSDAATQKVVLVRNYVGVAVDFTPADTFRGILGFNSQVLVANIIAPLNNIADNVANFNTVNSFLVHSDIVSQGFRFNSNYYQILAQVLIDVPAGNQILYRPQNPAKIPAPELRGSSRFNLRFWLTDDQNRPVNTNGEDWTARVVIRYQRPIKK